MKLISDNFELRYISNQSQANGETDFKGQTSTLDTDQRVKFLTAYAKRMEKQYEDFSLEVPIVTIEEAKERLCSIKPQPKPKVRKRIDLDWWKWIGYGTDYHSSKSEIVGNVIKIPGQFWRCMLQMKLSDLAKSKGFEICLGDAVRFGCGEDRQWYYYSDHKKISLPVLPITGLIKAELDFVYKKWNLYINDMSMCDFISFSDVQVSQISQITASAPVGDLFSQIWGVGYYPNEKNKFEPFFIETFIDVDTNKNCSIHNWTEMDGDEEGWESAVLPISHGGERYAGQDIYMRKKIYIEKLSDYAELYVESLTPGGEIYVNGRFVRQIVDVVWHKIDITDYLTEGENIIAVKVYADKIKERDKMTHTHTDLYTGWFAGRMHLDLIPEIYIEDVFAYTKTIEEDKAV